MARSKWNGGQGWGGVANGAVGSLAARQLFSLAGGRWFDFAVTREDVIIEKSISRRTMYREAVDENAILSLFALGHHVYICFLSSWFGCEGGAERFAEFIQAIHWAVDYCKVIGKVQSFMFPKKRDLAKKQLCPFLVWPLYFSHKEDLYSMYRGSSSSARRVLILVALRCGSGRGLVQQLMVWWRGVERGRLGVTVVTGWSPPGCEEQLTSCSHTLIFKNTPIQLSQPFLSTGFILPLPVSNVRVHYLLNYPVQLNSSFSLTELNLNSILCCFQEVFWKQN